MSKTFHDESWLVPKTTPQQQRRAAIILADLALQANGSIDQAKADLREVLDAIGLREVL